jgi:hypothetical protein
MGFEPGFLGLVREGNETHEKCLKRAIASFEPGLSVCLTMLISITPLSGYSDLLHICELFEFFVFKD